MLIKLHRNDSGLTDAQNRRWAGVAWRWNPLFLSPFRAVTNPLGLSLCYCIYLSYALCAYLQYCITTVPIQ